MCAPLRRRRAIATAGWRPHTGMTGATDATSGVPVARSAVTRAAGPAVKKRRKPTRFCHRALGTRHRLLLRQRAAGWALELGARQPARRLRGVRDRQPQTRGDADLLGEPRVGEGRAVLIARLVVALANVQLVLLLAPPGRSSDEISSRMAR